MNQSELIELACDTFSPSIVMDVLGIDRFQLSKYRNEKIELGFKRTVRLMELMDESPIMLRAMEHIEKAIFPEELEQEISDSFTDNTKASWSKEFMYSNGYEDGYQAACANIFGAEFIDQISSQLTDIPEEPLQDYSDVIPPPKKREPKNLGFKVTPKAKTLWETVPTELRLKILNNVWCSSCEKAININTEKMSVKKGLLHIEGKCMNCGEPASHIVDKS